MALFDSVLLVIPVHFPGEEVQLRHDWEVPEGEGERGESLLLAELPEDAQQRQPAHLHRDQTARPYRLVFFTDSFFLDPYGTLFY